MLRFIFIFMLLISATSYREKIESEDRKENIVLMGNFFKNNKNMKDNEKIKRWEISQAELREHSEKIKIQESIKEYILQNETGKIIFENLSKSYFLDLSNESIVIPGFIDKEEITDRKKERILREFNLTKVVPIRDVDFVGEENPIVFKETLKKMNNGELLSKTLNEVSYFQVPLEQDGILVGVAYLIKKDGKYMLEDYSNDYYGDIFSSLSIELLKNIQNQDISSKDIEMKAVSFSGIFGGIVTDGTKEYFTPIMNISINSIGDMKKNELYGMYKSLEEFEKYFEK